MAHERAIQDVESRGLAVEFAQSVRASSLEDAAAKMGIDPSAIVKTLVVKRHDGDFLLALIPGDKQIAWKKLRELVGVNKLQLPDASVALEATGYERGTITPLGALGDWPVYADASIVGKRISLGAGEHGWHAWVDADALVDAYSATVADISD